MTATELVARTLAELEAIEAAIHDWWFDAERIEHDGATIQIPCGPSNEVRDGWRRAPGGYSHMLTVAQVESVEQHDEAAIGHYDIERLTYRGETGELELGSAFPFVLTVRVSALDVTLMAVAGGG